LGMAIGKWDFEDAQKDVDFMRIVGKWANVLREVIVPLTENAPWCSDANAALCIRRLRSAPSAYCKSDCVCRHVGEYIGMLFWWFGYLV
jgi:hypothetical protein